ncbi:thiopurine S-methyltransferase-like [Asterias amurensis]|uniref:thiopurine S-methyltransferase-like n=1 Tax=Asterias amurensis TaxID=7602 RepID=UPI003AB82196
MSKTAAKENGICNGGGEGATCAKRMKLTDTHIKVISKNNGHPKVKQNSAAIVQSETVKTVENGHRNNGSDCEKVTVKKNQDGDVATGYVTAQDWKKKWESGKTRFHNQKVHRMLTKHIHRLVEGMNEPRMLIPLCGKTLDMVWFLDRGYSVVGCEIAELGVKQFFTENEIEYTTETLKDTDGLVYKGKDKDVTIYVTDFFTLTSALIGQFDCIWDRGSLAAINPDDRKRYRDVICDVLKPSGRYLLDIFEIPHDVFCGPPHNLDPEELKLLYGGSFEIEQLEHVDAMNPWSKSWGVTYFYENDFLLTWKK